MKIVGFVKCFNEVKTGHLERCLKHLDIICDDIFFCDDSSSDGSLELAKKFTKNTIILSDNFKDEINHKSIMLEKTLELEPDWIVSLDPDETFDRLAEEGGIRKLCEYGDDNNIEGFSFKCHNLWDGIDKFRVDELWWLNWQPKVWKNTGQLQYNLRPGLHHPQFPIGMKNIQRTFDHKLIHYGFNKPEFIRQKYENYKKHGQTGNLLSRLVNEDGIKFQPFYRDWIPKSSLENDRID